MVSGFSGLVFIEQEKSREGHSISFTGVPGDGEDDGTPKKLKDRQMVCHAPVINTTAISSHPVQYPCGYFIIFPMI
jgi:hypothetical protein